MITNVIVTAYCACKLCCGTPATGLCADGHRPVAGVTVAASRSIPLGTHVRLSGMTNDFIVQDRLARKYDSRVDIYFNNHQDALRFGKQKHTLRILP